MRTAALDCSARWTADAIRSSTDWRSATRRLNRWRGKGRGIAQLFRRITTIGHAENTLEGKRDRARAALHEVSFKKALKAHLKIVYGTDMGGIPWQEPMAQEFNRLVTLGMSPMEAIKAATSRAAEMLDSKGELGVLAGGAYADIIAVKDDPLKEIRQLENVSFVMKEGKIYKSELGK